MLDVSVALKPILEEAESHLAEIILNLKDNFKLSILVPEIFPMEFLNTVGRKLGKNAALEAYKSLAYRQISVIPHADDINKKALSLMEKYPKIAFYDALYHALAMIYNVPYVTSDQKYYEQVRREGNITLLENYLWKES